MILYQYPGGDGLSSLSPPCVKIDMALRRLGASHRVVDCRSPQEARKVSPPGRLPALHVDGRVVFDSIVILDELERRFPDADLFPRDPAVRLRDRLFEHLVNDNLYWHGFSMRWVAPETSERMFAATFGRMPLPVRWMIRLTFLRRLRARGRAQGVAHKPQAQLEADMERGLDMLEQGLEGGPFLQSREAPGRGDLAAASLIAQLGFRGTMPDLERRFHERTALVAHVRRVYASCAMDLPRWLREAR